MNKDVEKIRLEFQNAKKEFQRKGEKILKKSFKEFFAQNPMVKNVIWVAYTPYFNDGDACEFSVHDHEVKLKPEFITDELKEMIEKHSYSEDVAGDDYQYGSACAVKALEQIKDNKKSLTKEQEMLLTSHKDTIASIFVLKEVLQGTFGDHCMVVASPDGFSCSDYEHD